MAIIKNPLRSFNRSCIISPKSAEIVVSICTLAIFAAIAHRFSVVGPCCDDGILFAGMVLNSNSLIKTAWELEVCALVGLTLSALVGSFLQRISIFPWILLLSIVIGAGTVIFAALECGMAVICD